MDKESLRRQITLQKRALTAQQIASASARLAEQLFALSAYRQAKAIYCYLSFNQEVRTLPVIMRALQDGKRVAVPKTKDKQLFFYWLEEATPLLPNRYGIPEPEAAVRAEDKTALVLLPGLAFDAQGHRVGYGGGYYDRFLAEEPEHPTVALCYDFQKFATLPFAPHDKTADRILTTSITGGFG